MYTSCVYTYYIYRQGFGALIQKQNVVSGPFSELAAPSQVTRLKNRPAVARVAFCIVRHLFVKGL